MRFLLTDELLRALRERRQRQLAQRQAPSAPRARPGPRTPEFEPTLGGMLKALLASADPDVTAATDGFLHHMNSLQDEVERDHDAFLLDPGMGPMLYITADGRVLVDGRTWDDEAVREATDDEAIAGLVVGAWKTEIAALLELLPPRPDDGLDCPMCRGSRKLTAGERELEVICIVCWGRAWVVQRMLDEAAAKGIWPLRES